MNAKLTKHEIYTIFPIRKIIILAAKILAAIKSDIISALFANCN